MAGGRLGDMLNALRARWVLEARCCAPLRAHFLAVMRFPGPHQVLAKAMGSRNPSKQTAPGTAFQDLGEPPRCIRYAAEVFPHLTFIPFQWAC